MGKKCLKCKLIEPSCKCKGGFKIVYFNKKPLSKKEADRIPKIDTAMKELKIVREYLEKINSNGRPK